MRNHRYFIAALAFAGMAFAQDAQTQDKPKTQTDSVVPQSDGGSPTTAKPANGPRRKPATEPAAPTAKTSQGKADVPLTPTAEEAVRVSAQWMSSKNAPAAGPDGKVLYSYGAGLPTIVCAPLRVCIIELQPGEKIVGEPQIGRASCRERV